MTIRTQYDYGDTLIVDGEEMKIISAHIYVSKEGTHTERYYLGNEKWITIRKGGKVNEY